MPTVVIRHPLPNLAPLPSQRFATLMPTAGTSEPLHEAIISSRNATWLDSMIR